MPRMIETKRILQSLEIQARQLIAKELVSCAVTMD